MPRPRVVIMAAVARNGVIGHQGAIPWHLPEDFAHFKATTYGHALIMGRATYESIGRPLPGRSTVVVTANPAWRPTDEHAGMVRVAASLPAALEVARELDPSGPVFLQGGSSIYAEGLGLADELLLTWVDAEPQGDTHFPRVDWDSWREEWRRDIAGGTVVSYEKLPA